MSEMKVTLGEYKGVEVTARKAEVSEGELRAELERARSYATETVDKNDAAEMDDEVTLDFVGYFDGVPFENGSGESYPIVLGSNTFIPGFEEQLVGAKAGDTVDVRVNFPEDYHAPECAGKEALFVCTIKAVRTTVVPELSDEIVAKISNCATVEEFKAFVESEIRRFKEDQNLQEKENEALGKVVMNSEVEIPEEMLQEQVEMMKRNYIAQLQNEGHTLEDVLSANNVTEAEMDANVRAFAEDMLKGEAVLNAIVEKEGLTCTKEELDEEIALVAQNYQMDPAEFRQRMGEERLSKIGESILTKRALDLIVAEAVEVE